MSHETAKKKPTLGSLFAGIGGFDLGFERAGWQTKWQVEKGEAQRLVLSDRFPLAERFSDITQVGGKELSSVDCVTAGFPCQDFSMAGACGKNSRTGLQGPRSSLFFEVIRILKEVQPAWLVLENVPDLLSVNDGKDFETIIRSLADCGYLGFWRVLDGAYFGVPQRRRRIFLVAGLGRYPCPEFLLDAGPMDLLFSATFPESKPRSEVSFAGYTLQAHSAPCQFTIGCETLVAEEDGWDQMVERSRMSRLHGIPKGLDEVHFTMRHCAGNAVIPAVAQWIAELLKKSMRGHE